MNKVILIGRLTKDVDLRVSATGKSVARYTVAINRMGEDAGADFINCVAFDKAADFADKNFTKGMRVAVEGRLNTGSYTNKEGQKVYTTDVLVERQEFADSKNTSGNGFEKINAAIETEGFTDDLGELPFAPVSR